MRLMKLLMLRELHQDPIGASVGVSDVALSTFAPVKGGMPVSVAFPRDERVGSDGAGPTVRLQLAAHCGLRRRPAPPPNSKRQADAYSLITITPPRSSAQTLAIGKAGQVVWHFNFHGGTLWVRVRNKPHRIVHKKRLRKPEI